MITCVNLDRIHIIDDIVAGKVSAMSILTIQEGGGCPVIPTVRAWGETGHYALIFGINHFYAARLDGRATMDVMIVEEGEEIG